MGAAKSVEPECSSVMIPVVALGSRITVESRRLPAAAVAVVAVAAVVLVAAAPVFAVVSTSFETVVGVEISSGPNFEFALG